MHGYAAKGLSSDYNATFCIFNDRLSSDRAVSTSHPFYFFTNVVRRQPLCLFHRFRVHQSGPLYPRISGHRGSAAYFGQALR
jgi:hypothetical protein